MPVSFGSAGIIPTTPDRQTVVEFDGYNYQYERPGWFMRREGDEIGRAPSIGNFVSLGGSDTRDVELLPGGTWVLKPHRGESAQLLNTYYNDAVTRLADVNAAPGLVEVPLHRIPTLLNIAPSASMAASATGFRKTVPHTAPISGDWSKCNLPADLTAYAQPPNATDQLIPLDRVIQGAVTYPENTGFGLIFNIEHGWWGMDGFLSFYFGGETSSIYPRGTHGGAYCLQLRGSGWAHLWEGDRDNNGVLLWRERTQFKWSDPGRVADTFHSITFLPVAFDRIVFQSRTSGSPTGAHPSMFVAAMAMARPPDPTTTLYEETLPLTGHVKGFSMTGAGIIRLDARRDLRSPVAIYRLKFPVDGWLFDAPFRIDFPLPANTPIYVSPETYHLLGGRVDVQLYGATSGTACALGTDSNGFAYFGSIANEQCYYAVFHFVAGPLGWQTPVLFSYTAEVIGLYNKQILSPTIPTQAVVQDVTATGPDVTPDHETCSFVYKDLQNEVPQLQKRDGIPTVVKVIKPSDNSLIGYLHEGITLRPEAEWRGKKGGTFWASDQYRAYDPLRIIGIWAQLARKMGRDLLDFREDPNAAPDPNTGAKPPWLVTDIIDFLLKDAGVPPDEIDVPQGAMRLWSSPKLSKDQYTFQPGLSYTDYLTTLTIRFLGQYLVRDRNAGPYGKGDVRNHGMWRLLNNPQPPFTKSSNVLCTFYHSSRSSGGGVTRFSSDPDSYPAGSTFCRKFKTYPKPPEFNYLLVTSTGELNPGANGKIQNAWVWWNPKAVNVMPGGPYTADPTSSDFTDGQLVPMVVYDPLLSTPEALAAVGTRLKDFAGHGELWAQWTAPMQWIWDPADHLQAWARPLRINDLVYFPEVGTLVLVRNCNPLWQRDAFQWMDCEGKVVAQGV